MERRNTLELLFYISISILSYLHGNFYVSILSLSLSAYDKTVARKGSLQRVPEYFFVVAGFAGGGAGLFLSFILFNHKVRKPPLIGSIVIAVLLRYFCYRFLPF